jgi:anti-anti-sigma factor
MYPAADGVLGLCLCARTECGYVIAALRGELDIASAPTLREQLLGLLCPAPSRLIIDLSAVSYADASGLAVLVSTARRAGLLGGHLRLASPSPEVARVLSITGLNQQLDTFPTVHAAITSPPGSPHRHVSRADGKSGSGIPGTAHGQPAAARTRPPRYAADGGELRLAIAAVLLHADAWHDADPSRQFTPALHDLAQAYTGTSQAWLTQAAHTLLSVLTRQPLTHSPAVAATASHLRRLLGPPSGRVAMSPRSPAGGTTGL